MTFNYSKLRGRIVEKVGTIKNLAKIAEISEHSLSFKLNNKVEWRQSEIMKLVPILELDPDDIGVYFFTKDVQFN